VGIGLVVKAELDGAEEAPQPLPISFAVMVSGTFIMDDTCFGGGDGSTGPHALVPQGSILVENRLLVILEVEVGGVADACCCFCDGSLKTEFVVGDVFGGGSGGEVVATGVVKRPNMLSEVAEVAAFDFVGPILVLAKLKPCPMDEIDGVFVWCG
jgi:hypothetical protein